MGTVRWAAWGAVCLALLAPPHLLSSYFLYLFNLIGIYVLLSVGLNLLTGYTGQVSLGHAGLFGIGAYTSALLEAKLGWPFGVSLPAAALFTAGVGLLVSLPALRIGGHYLALVTFAFGRIVQLIMIRWNSLTNGYDGLAVSRPAIGGFALNSDGRLYYLIIPITVLMVLAAMNLVNSRVGRAFVAVRDSPTGSQMMGVNPAVTKTTAFIVSAFYTGVAGALFGALTRFLSPDVFGLFESALFLMMIIIGGIGSIAGSVLGAVLMVLLPEALRGAQEYQEILYGVLFVLALIFMPKGLYGFLKQRLFAA